MVRGGWLCACVLPLLVAAPAAAQPVDAATKAQARALAAEGLKLYDAGDCGNALEKLTKAHAMVKAPTLALYAGRCLELLVRLVDASEMYRAATQDELEPGASTQQKQAQADAAKALAELAGRLGSVEIVLASGASEVAVTLDGKTLPAAALGTKRPIDPGAHRLELRRGEAVGSRDFTVKEGEAVRRRRLTRARKRCPRPLRPPRSRHRLAPGSWVARGSRC